MLSVCSTIYGNPDNLEVFVRSLVGNSTTKDFEIIIVDDEELCKDKLIELKKEFPQLKSIPRTKKDKAKFAEKLIEYYQVNHIFSKELLDEMRGVVSSYKLGTRELWLPTPHNFNLAAKKAKGDMLLFLPADYLIFFDLAKVSEGHFDWLDIGSLDPYPDFSKLKGLKKEEFRDFTEEILDRAFKSNIMRITAQHGARVVSMEKYKKIGGFDERWFIRAIGEDLFNRQTGMTPLSQEILFLTSPFVGCIRGKGNSLYYLSPKYTINAEDHNFFLNEIRRFLKLDE
jgi:glycosyltransferase involved in cell wall biosynthesis